MKTKIAILILLLAVLASLFSAAAAGEEPEEQGASVVGDLNGDGMVTIEDVTWLLDYISGNGSGQTQLGEEVSIITVTMLLDYIAAGPSEPQETVLVQFLDFDGTLFEAQIVISGGNASLPENEPQSDDFRFDGWDVEPDRLQGLTENLTVSPLRTPKHAVTFLDGDGTTLSVQRVVHGENAVPPEAPTREGYHFTAWNGETDDVTEDRVITAEYEANIHEAVFRYRRNGETVEESAQYAYGQAILPPETDAYFIDDYDEPQLEKFALWRLTRGETVGEYGQDGFMYMGDGDVAVEAVYEFSNEPVVFVDRIGRHTYQIINEQTAVMIDTHILANGFTIYGVYVEYVCDGSLIAENFGAQSPFSAWNKLANNEGGVNEAFTYRFGAANDNGFTVSGPVDLNTITVSGFDFDKRGNPIKKFYSVDILDSIYLVVEENGVMVRYRPVVLSGSIEIYE